MRALPGLLLILLVASLHGADFLHFRLGYEFPGNLVAGIMDSYSGKNCDEAFSLTAELINQKPHHQIGFGFELQTYHHSTGSKNYNEGRYQNIVAYLSLKWPLFRTMHTEPHFVIHFGPFLTHSASNVEIDSYYYGIAYLALGLEMHVMNNLTAGCMFRTYSTLFLAPLPVYFHQNNFSIHFGYAFDLKNTNK